MTSIGEISKAFCPLCGEGLEILSINSNLDVPFSMPNLNLSEPEFPYWECKKCDSSFDKYFMLPNRSLNCEEVWNKDLIKGFKELNSKDILSKLSVSDTYFYYYQYNTFDLNDCYSVKYLNGLFYMSFLGEEVSSFVDRNILKILSPELKQEVAKFLEVTKWKYIELKDGGYDENYDQGNSWSFTSKHKNQIQNISDVSTIPDSRYLFQSLVSKIAY